MGSITEGVKTVNSTLRTAVFAAFVGILGTGGYIGYNEYTEHERIFLEQEAALSEAKEQLISLQGDLESKVAEIAALNIDLAAKIEMIEKLETSMHLLKTDQRLARLNVLEIQRNEEGRPISTKLEFVELSPRGDALSTPKQFELPGDLVYVDNWVVKFDDAYIEQADIERGTSLCLFRRIFSEEQQPTEGFSLDEIGMRPQAYARGGALTDFEKRLWADFWEFANDPEKAAEMGIRAANGEAVSIKVREGKSYNITLRASGGLSIEPITTTEAQVE